ncbi:MAG: chorismate mutase [Acidimicrobiaceae bacterium]|jgi:chorismate mutase|nr:chorismate mutase [Acidimicrobiaceae bacterium]
MEAVLRAIRGATTVDQDDAEQVSSRTQALVREILAANEIANDDLVSMIFTVTADIVSAFPATAARGLGLDDVALLGAVESPVVGSMPRCIRVLVHCYSARERSELRHIYLEGASRLRADLAEMPRSPSVP